MLIHELVKEKVSRERLVFALCRVGTQAEMQDCRDYLTQTGYRVLDGGLFEKPAYRQAQNEGLAITETRYKSLNSAADALIESIANTLTGD
jgi:chromosome partitioning protein